jgi:hypothetical protein
MSFEYTNRVYKTFESEKENLSKFATSALEKEKRELEESITEEEKQIESMSELPTIQAEDLKNKRNGIENISKKIALLSTKKAYEAGSFRTHGVPESLETDLC